MKKKTIHKRRWLKPSDPETKSYVAWSAYRHGSFEVTIADCNRNITLSFYHKKDAKKLDILIKELQDFRELMGEKGENINDN